MNKKFRSINFLYYNNPGLAKTPVSEKRQSKLRYQTDETGGDSCLPPPAHSTLPSAKKGRISRQGRNYITALTWSMNSRTWWIFQLSHWPNQPRLKGSKKTPALYIQGATESPLTKKEPHLLLAPLGKILGLLLGCRVSSFSKQPGDVCEALTWPGTQIDGSFVSPIMLGGQPEAFPVLPDAMKM